MFSKPIKVIFILVIVIAIVLLLLKRVRVKMTNNWLPLCLIAMYPFVWCIIIREHSALHAFFVHRIIAIDILAVLLILYDSLELRKMY